MKNSGKIIYIERLSLGILFKAVISHLGTKQVLEAVWVFDSTKTAFALARWLGGLFGFQVEKIDFQMKDVRDEEGVCIALRVRHEGLAQLQGFIKSEYPQDSYISKIGPRVEAFLAKASVWCHDIVQPRYSELWRALLLIGVVQWHQKAIVSNTSSVSLYMYERPFAGALQRYADMKGVRFSSLGSYYNFFHFLDQWWRFWGKLDSRLFRNIVSDPGRWFLKRELRGDRNVSDPGLARIMTEYTGQLNLDRPECFSDLFFLNEEGVQGKDACLVFHNRIDPIDKAKFCQLSARGIMAVARTAQSSLINEEQVPVFRYEGCSNLPKNGISPWVSYLQNYSRSRDYWRAFFSAFNIKVTMTWLKYDPGHMVMADALEDIGGISCVYQRSLETNPSPYFAVGSNIVFGFSPSCCEILQQSGSSFRNHVSVGYAGESRFEHMRPIAQRLRQQLMARGAKRIIVYFEENSVKDGRWFVGNRALSESYAFWLTKVLKDKELGIILKPKVPGTLDKRLGSVACLLKDAESTGRCHVFREGALQGWFSPAVAAMAGDFSVQDCLWGATASFEAALSGAKALISDREGWPMSPLYSLGPDVVFKDDESLWRACQDHWRTPGGNSRLGDWAVKIHDMDPFHDGHADVRVSDYLKGLLEGLRRGEPRVEIMDRMAEAYARRWGKDKIQRGCL